MEKTLNASTIAYQLRLKEHMLGGIDQRMQKRGGKNTGRSLKNLAVSKSRNSRQDGVPPVRQRAGAVIQMSTSENDGGQKQRPIGEAQFLHDRILDESTEQDLFRESSRRQDQQKAREQEPGRQLRRDGKGADEGQPQPDG